METEKIQPGEPVVINDITIIPIIKTALYAIESGQNFVSTGTRYVERIVIIQSSGCRVYSVNGDELPISDILAEFPQLSEFIPA